MTKLIPIPPPGFDDLSVDQKIEYIQSLWERIAADPSKVPVPDWHREVVEERLKGYREQPEQGSNWEQVREDVEQKLRNRPPKK